MKLHPFHYLADVTHPGYRGWLGTNPNIEVATPGSKLSNDSFIWLCAWGDGETLLADLAAARKLGPCIFNVTGDSCYVPGYNDGNTYFVTTLNPMSPCRQVQVPYSYHQSVDWWLKFTLGGNVFENWGHPRKYLASFQGSMGTNPRRRRLFEMAKADILIKERDGWQAAQAGQWDCIEEHSGLILNSAFTLCPRGIGQSSIRVTEAIFRGSVPVLLDDATKPFGESLPFAVRGSLSGDLNALEAQLRSILATDYVERLFEMRKWRDTFLLGDHFAGCTGTVGYTNWIRGIVCN